MKLVGFVESLFWTAVAVWEDRPYRQFFNLKELKRLKKL